MDAGHVAYAAVATHQEDAAAQRGLDGDEQVETVDREAGAGGCGDGNLRLPPPFQAGVRAGRTGDGDALPLVELITVADDFEGGGEGIVAGQEPGEVRYGRAQLFKLGLAEKPPVVGVCATVPARVGTYEPTSFMS